MIESSVASVHTFESGDVDRDGDRDLVTAEMHQAPDPDEAALYLNGGRRGGWRRYLPEQPGAQAARSATWRPPLNHAGYPLPE